MLEELKKIRESKVDWYIIFMMGILYTYYHPIDAVTEILPEFITWMLEKNKKIPQKEETNK